MEVSLAAVAEDSRCYAEHCYCRTGQQMDQLKAGLYDASGSMCTVQLLKAK